MSIATDFRHEATHACHCSTTQAIEQWLDESAGGERRLEYAISALEWCRRLPKLADMLPAAVWQRLQNHLVHAANEAATTGFDDGLMEADPATHQLLAGELAMTLATLFPDDKTCRRLLRRTREALSRGLTDLLDGEGLPHARHFSQVRLLLACWTRCRTLGKRWKCGCWSAEADARYRQFIRNALRLVRRDGSFAFEEESKPNDLQGAAVVAAAVAMVGDKAEHDLAAIVLPGGKKKRTSQTGVALPPAAIHSEWAAAAVLRTGWSRSAPRLSVLYPGASCRVELACGKDVLWSGEWRAEVRVDGTPALPASEWSDTCWFSDKDVDYLELELELGEGLCIQRHFVLARKERFLLLADAVLGGRWAALDYRGSLPLGHGITFCQANDTNEGVLTGRKARAVAMPLALSEWRDDAFQHAKTSTEHGAPRQRCLFQAMAPERSFQAVAHDDGSRSLELRQSTYGRALFAPLFFDLDRGRFGKPLTWRQLTVAESMAVQPEDLAAGYRVSAGGRQWLIYRSLGPSRNRTLLGHNLSSETLLARFTGKGEVESLIEIES
jgi:hypothetical protein